MSVLTGMANLCDTFQVSDGSECALTATVLELLPNGGVSVELGSGERVLAHPAGVRKINFVRLRPSDRVMVELAPGDRTRGRIVKLLRQK